MSEEYPNEDPQNPGQGLPPGVAPSDPGEQPEPDAPEGEPTPEAPAEEPAPEAPAEGGE